MKVLAKNAITSTSYTTNILMMTMSKVFDTVRRGAIIQYLKRKLQQEELHLIKELLKNLQLSINVNGHEDHYSLRILVLQKVIVSLHYCSLSTYNSPWSSLLMYQHRLEQQRGSGKGNGRNTICADSQNPQAQPSTDRRLHHNKEWG